MSSTETALWAVQYQWGQPAPGYSFASWPVFDSWKRVRVRNDGPFDALGVTARLAYIPANVRILDGDVSLGNIPVGQSLWSTDNFRITTDMAHPAPRCEGVVWRISYRDAAGIQYERDVPEFPPGPAPGGCYITAFTPTATRTAVALATSTPTPSPTATNTETSAALWPIAGGQAPSGPAVTGGEPEIEPGGASAGPSATAADTGTGWHVTWLALLLAFGLLGILAGPGLARRALAPGGGTARWHLGRRYLTLGSISCLLLVLASGLLGAALTPSSGAALFGPAPALAADPSTDLPLEQGWNLVSLPHVPANTDPATVLASISGSYDRASTYRRCDTADPIKDYSPVAPAGGDLAAIDHTMGLWLHTTTGVSLTVEGPPPTELSTSLCAGWNLIGYPLPERPVAEALISIAGKYDRVYGYDPADGADPWAIHDPLAPNWANDLQSLQPGRGYWVLATENVTLTLSNTALPPTVTDSAPADGAVVTAPAPVQVIVVPPAGQVISSWALTYQRASLGAPATEAVSLASGSGTPPATLATFDPTLLPNGTYVLSFTATANGGGSQTATATVVVAGNLKLGRFKTTYQDLDVPVDGFQMQVLRSYDSIDKNVGDFGVGWRLDLANFRVEPNRVLGAGGWTRVTVPCSWFFCTDVENATARFVTVVYPDGRTEVFDFDPVPGGGLFSNVGAAFVARPGTGTTSRLEVAGGNPVLFWGGGHLTTDILGLGGGIVFDPQQFQLTTLDGRVLILDRTTGLVSMTDPNGNTLQVTAGGVFASNGTSIVFARDDAGRITEVTGPLSETVRYEYSAAGDLAATTDADGNRLSYSYDADHTLLSTAGPAGQPLETLHYDAEGRLTAVTDAMSNTIQINNDVDGRQQRVTDRLGRLTTVYTYDEQGNIVHRADIFDGTIVSSTTTYDSAGRPLTDTDALGLIWQNAYDAVGNPTETQDPLGNVTRYSYDANGRIAGLTTADDTVVTLLSYDAQGNPVRQEHADGTAFTYAYDSAGHLVTVTNPASNTITYGYDSSGRLSMITDEEHNVSRVTMDASGRVTSVTDPGNATIALAHDQNGNLTQITGPTGHSRSFTYDLGGNVTKMTDPLSRTVTYEYDPAGRMLRTTDRNGAVITYTYDANGQLVRKELPNGEITTITYDGGGRITALTNSASVIEYTYDARGGLLSKTTRGTLAVPLPTTTITYTYDARGQRLSMTSPAGTTSYTYDQRLRLTALTDPAGGTHGLAYDMLSRLTSLSRPNGVTDTLSYDAAGNLLARVANLDTTTLAHATYSYDALGRPTSLTDLSGTHAFGYDAGSQLTAATHPTGSGLADETYTYDLAGNRTSSALSASYTYDGADRLVSDERFTYQFDNEGNLIRRTETASGAATTFHWSAEHLLLAIHFPDGTTTSYKYDPLGRRIEINAADAVTRYVYDGANVLLEYDGASNLVASYVTGLEADDVLAMVRDGQTYYYLKDALWSTTALVDAAGSVVARYAYDAFGQQVVSGSLANPFTYTGREYDAKSGLYYYRLRYYDPSTGRFLSEDPELDFNPYPYVSNCPVDLVDPTGANATSEYVYVTRDRVGRCYFGITRQTLGARFLQHTNKASKYYKDLATPLTPLGQFSKAVARQLEGALIRWSGGARYIGGPRSGLSLNRAPSGRWNGGPLGASEVFDGVNKMLDIIRLICPGLVPI